MQWRLGIGLLGGCPRTGSMPATSSLRDFRHESLTLPVISNHPIPGQILAATDFHFRN
jgi:hypothetical protein